jgi:hypothetical protein
MSDADRAACRDRLAEGAKKAPYLSRTDPAKLAYYDAVAKSQEDWHSGRDPGHAPAVGCVIFFGSGEKPKPPPHALRLGPCIIEPPRGSLDPDVDVQPPGKSVSTWNPPDALSANHTTPGS